MANTKPFLNYSLLDRLEWHLSRFRLLALAIDYLIHRPSRIWQHWLWNKRCSSESLCNFESKVYSQNGEDGIIDEIFKRIGEGDKFAVEFGVEDGSECCTKNLLVNHGWKGLLIDGSEESVQIAKDAYSDFDLVDIVCSFITVENILNIFDDSNMPKSPDLLVVDIDGNDYWILKQILSAYSPRVVVVEYNAKWIPPKQWVMPYNPEHCWDGSAHFGASLAALTKLATQYGYSLVGCESRGVNSFFVRDDLLKDKFAAGNKGAAYHYVPPNYGSGFGYPLRSRSSRHIARSL